MKNKILSILILALAALSANAQDDFDPTPPGEPNALYRVTVGIDTPEAGSVYGSGSYTEGTKVTVYKYNAWLPANSPVRYEFRYWTLNGEEYTSESSFTYVVGTMNASFVAVYDAIYKTPDVPLPDEPNMSNDEFSTSRVFVEISPADACNSHTTSGQRYYEENYAEMYCYPNPGFEFLGWYQGNTLKSKERFYNFYVGEDDATLTAKFEYNPAIPSEPNAPIPSDVENFDFAYGDVGDVNIVTYAKDGDVNRMQPVPGWEYGVDNVDACAAGVVSYGSGTTLNGAAYTVPTSGPDDTNGNALAMLAVWTGKVQYVKQVTLPAGEYTMTVPIYNSAGTAAIVKNLIGVKYGETSVYATTKNYAVGKWIDEVVTFELSEETEVTISLGYEAGNVGSASSQHLFLDRVAIDVYKELEVTKAKALAALPVATSSIFTPSIEAVKAARAAIEAATTVAEIEAVDTNFEIPALSGEYTICNTKGNCYLGTEGEAVVLKADPVKVTFEAADGGFYIKAGDVYVNMKGNNNWSMSANAGSTTAWNFNLADGNYTIQGPKGMIGSDNTAAGSTLYGNKTASGNGVWTITKCPDNATSGDVNNDGSTDVQDVVACVNVVLTDSSNKRADVNKDGVVDVQDVVSLVNMILNNE